MNSNISIFSFFSGAGFLDLGFEELGYNISFVNEISATFMKAYKYSRQKMNLPQPEFGYSEEDITNFTESKGKRKLKNWVSSSRKINNIVGFIGGPPCPDFSVGGKNRGQTGDNGKLSQTYTDIICSQKPDFFLFENVKGLWSTKKHRLFYDKLKKQFSKAGYIMTDRLINAIEYGAPQYRDRIILIGFHKNSLTTKKYFSTNNSSNPTIDFPWDKFIKYPREKTFSLPWPTSSKFIENSNRKLPNGILPELTVNYWFEKNNVENHPNSKHYFKPRAGLQKFLAIDEGDDSKKSFKRLHRWRYSPTVCYGNNEVHLHPYKARRLSVAEALSLQSLPSDFELPEDMSLTAMFKTVGNGVPYKASKNISRSISYFIKDKLCLA